MHVTDYISPLFAALQDILNIIILSAQACTYDKENMRQLHIFRLNNHEINNIIRSNESCFIFYLKFNNNDILAECYINICCINANIPKCTDKCSYKLA